MKSSVFQSKHLLSDSEILALGISINDVELYRRNYYQIQFGIDTWITNEVLQNHTFKTKIIDLTYEEAKAIAETKISPNSTVILEQLVLKIDEVIKEFPSGYVFVKLSTRSPKDATLYDFKNEGIQKLVEQEIRIIDEGIRDDNTETIAFIKATTKAMKISTGKEALQLFKSSSRIREDLNKILQFPQKLFNSKIVIREWIDELASNPQGEFRGFVHNNKLNALTQYYSFCYFEELVNQKKIIQERILIFFELIKEHFSSHSSYVIDFFVLPERIYVIEINPFHSGAGACLFSWIQNRDLFLNGPFEFRITEKLTESPRDLIPLAWQRFIDDKFHPKNKSEDDVDQPPERKQSWWMWTSTFLFFVGLFVYKRYKS